MQNLLTYTTTAIALLFVAITMIDFATGLAAAWQNAAVEAQPQVAALPAIEQPTAQEQTIAPQIEPALQQETRSPATLQWIEQNMPPVEVWASEMPDAIVLCKARLPQTQPLVEVATRQQLVAAGIRKCKKLASQLKIHRYST
jgi:hypothetical protein